MTLAFLAPAAAVILLFFVGVICVRATKDGYHTSWLVVIVSAFTSLLASALFQPYSFLGLFPRLVGPLVLGVVVGSWPDARSRWSALLRRDIDAFRDGVQQDWHEWKEWPVLVGTVLGAGLGLWAWSALAAWLGALGSLVGAVAFVAVVIVVLILVFLATDTIRPQGNEPIEP
ncbi:MAG: hypothetical protein AB7N70_27600 [Dehalococcoidia bacterium]